MLKHSLYKKFAKKSFQPGGENKNGNGNGNGDENPFSIPTLKLPPSPSSYTTKAQPEGTITDADTSYAPGTFNTDQAPNTFTSDASPLLSNTNPDNIYDVDQSTPGMEQGPLTQKETQKRGVMAPEKTPSLSTMDKLKGAAKDAWGDFKDNWQDYTTLGLAGISAGLNYQDDLRRQHQLQTNIQKRGVDAKPLHDYNWMYGRTTSGGTEYQPTIMAQDGANLTPRYAQGGMNSTNVEIEGGEFLILPDGTTEIAKGPSHKNGGIDTILPEGTKVFSNHLRPMDLHKMKPDQKLGLVNKYMQEGGDTSMGMGLDYINDLKSKLNSTKNSTEDKNTYSTQSKNNKHTFAQIAKKYDLKQFQEILDNPFASAVDKQTAEILIRRNSQILEQLFRDQQILNGNSSGEPMTQETQMAKGGIHNPGFEALPGYVQAKITANMQSGGRKYKLPDNAVIIDEKDQAKANVGDYVRSADGTIKKVTKKDVKQVQEGFNRSYEDMEARWNDPKMQPIKDAMYQKYKANHPESKITPEQFNKNYMNAQKQFYAIQEAHAKDPNFDITSQDWDKTAGGMKNKKYTEAANKLGFKPLTEDEAKQFQEAYLNLADMQNDPKYKDQLQDFDFRPKGVGDQMYLGKPISGADAIVGNTTIGQVQYLKNMKEHPELQFENVPEEPPTGGDYNITEGARGKYERQPFPTSQYIPGAYGLAQAQEAFTPAIPEVAAPYVRPQTLNIQSQLQDADNNAIAAMRYGADPNLAYIAGLDAKEKAFQTKQNYDAEGRWKADLYNADAKFKADTVNADAFNAAYNDMYATTLSNQSEAKQAAINNLVTQRNKWNQDENLKEFYLNTYGPSLDKKKDQNRLDVTPGATTYSWGSSSPTTSNTTPSKTNVNNLETIKVPESIPNTMTSSANELTKNMQPLDMQTKENPYTFANGGELDNYLNPFKKKKVKGFNKK